MNKEKEKNKILHEQYVPNAQFYSQIVDSLQDYAIFTVDKELNINSWNAAATKIFQFTTDEILGKPFEIIFTQEDRESGIPKLEIDGALKKGRSNDVRWHLCKNGKTFYADGLVFPLKDEKDKIIGFVKILRDITKRKAAEEAIKKYAKELEELNTHKENVLTILSHDLRSPLAGIIQAAEYLKLNFETIEPDFAIELLEELHAASVKELNMLDYLVEWARIKYAAEAFVPEKIDLCGAITQVFESLKETAAINSIKFLNNVDEKCFVFADSKMVNSILQNLISNAIKHSKKEGKIILSTQKREDMMIVKIQDSGSGMDKQTQDELFSPQVKSLTKTVEKNNGAGIGLLLVKGFLEKNGGHIWVESEEGKGSSFYFTLPINKSSLNKLNKNVLEEVQAIDTM